jgi:hypothetical protein
MKTESVSGAYNTFTGTNRNTSVGDTYSLKVANECQEGFGNRTVTCNKGSHKLTIFTVGDISETINIRGNKSVNLTSGNITEFVKTLGNRSFQATTGNFKVNVLTKGNITNKVGIGNLVSATKAGKMNLSSTLGTNIKTAAAMRVQGLKVNLKTPSPLGKVITKLTSVCYVTGVPNPGHPMITA